MNKALMTPYIYCKRLDSECAAKLLKINKNKDIICYRFRKN